jgi:Leucine-rich repeat (LRR) protein
MKYFPYLNLAVALMFICSTLGATALAAPASEFSCGDVTEIPQAECEALVTFYNATNGFGWTRVDGWLSSTLPSTWYGVTVVDGHVVSLYLSDNQLGGYLPAELQNLPYLDYLNLKWNYITGSIPAEVGNLSNLTYLSFGYNQLSGSIPIELANLNNLEVLSLFSNRLTGSIPPQLGNLTMLAYFNLMDNDLSGNIPPELGNLTSLDTLVLSYNHLSGNIPAALGNLASLTGLLSSDNQLSGAIPPELGNLTNLNYLNLGRNRLTGALPAELFNLFALDSLSLPDNQLSGDLPASLANLTNLIDLDLSNNLFTGTIPHELSDLTNLRILNLSSNQLTGSIPIELSNLSMLLSLYLENNQLSGDIPEALGTVTGLIGLQLGNNMLTGSIPDSIGNLLNLTTLHLQGNQLEGDIPSTFIQLQNLYDPGEVYGGLDGLDLDYNFLNVPPGYPDPLDPLQQFLSLKDPDWQLYQGFTQLIGTGGGELISLDGRTDLLIPEGALITDTIFTFMPQPEPLHSYIGQHFANNNFQLSAEDGIGNPVTLFNLPITATLTYTDTDIIGIDELGLRLNYWQEDGSLWTDAVTTCPGGEYTRDPDNHMFWLPLCHLTEFGVFGAKLNTTFLPVATRE